MDPGLSILEARRASLRTRSLSPVSAIARKEEAEGGCGVVGLASSRPVEGRYLLASLRQMKNRGNGKGGGVAAVGLSAEQLGVSQKVLNEDYILQIAYLDPSARAEVEKRHVFPAFEIDHARPFPAAAEPGRLGLEVPPPEVWAYFARPKAAAVEDFGRKHALEGLDGESLKDEFVYQNSFGLNQAFYASLGEKRAFVLSHGKNMLVFKLVGYGDHVIEVYGLQNLAAHVWVGHHRYPTKGRVWHPGGAHPFVGMNEALVHNGDFANYHSITTYLHEHGISPLFLTDTEVSVLLFDLLRRTYGYPLEHVCESLAPTTELDYEMLPEEKKRLYRRLQQAHIHGSPDGPWFFIIASHPRNGKEPAPFELIGITDTSMLRPQVFALQKGTPARGTQELGLGLIASEKQAIDAVLRALHEDGKAHAPYADLYWNARGGSYTDGGAFVFSVEKGALSCRNKFGGEVPFPSVRAAPLPEALTEGLKEAAGAQGPEARDSALGRLTELLDSRVLSAGVKRSAVAALAEEGLEKILSALPRLGSPSAPDQLVDWEGRSAIQSVRPCRKLAVDARDFPPEGDQSLARFIVQAAQRGFKKIICFRLRGQRFLGCGLGPRSRGLTLELYGSSGDYLASGLDGAELIVHGSAQDQVGNIMKSGRLVIHGDAGQCFMYGAKGGSVYVLGNAAGRPLINAVGTPKVVLNGTALDYLAESFMAGDPLEGGGFVIVNGVGFDPEGRLGDLPTPYPGGNLFSLASGGAIYIRDPERKVGEDQLNGGEFEPMTDRDWELIRPCLEENERLFGIRLDALLAVKGQGRPPAQVYRKIGPIAEFHR